MRSRAWCLAAETRTVSEASRAELSLHTRMILVRPGVLDVLCVVYHTARENKETFSCTNPARRRADPALSAGASRGCATYAPARAEPLACWPHGQLDPHACPAACHAVR